MIPLTIIAHLHTPPIVREPILFDGVLMGGLGAALGAARPDGWADTEDVYATPLPLARVETPADWWYAASQATPHGPEQTVHAHRRMPAEHYVRWTSERGTNFAAGPDKGLRTRLFTRPAMLAIRWTCVGDRSEIARLLSYVPGVGNRVTHGWGQVARWEVTEGGPDLSTYATDVRLRHLPLATIPAPNVVASIAHKRLTPPYWRRDEAVSCWVIPALFEETDA